MGSCTTRTYRHGSEELIGSSIDQVSELLQQSGAMVWIDLDHPTRPELERLAEELGLHQLSVEDALDEHQRDKYVHYEHHVFLVAHGIELDLDRTELLMTEIDIFISEHWLVTVHQGGEHLMERVVKRWETVRRTEGESPGFALYALLDVVVDGYFTTLDRFERFYDEAADRVFAETPIHVSEQRQWFEMRRALNQFDRTVGPLAEALHTVVARDLDRFPDAAAPYLRDVQGELARASAEVDSLRELVQHIVDVNLLLRDYQQNAIVKKVTSWAAIVAVPTLVTGYYGMNVPFPGSERPWGVVAATALGLGGSAGLYVLFRKKGWM